MPAAGCGTGSVSVRDAASSETRRRRQSDTRALVQTLSPRENKNSGAAVATRFLWFFGSLVWVFLPRLDARRRTVDLLLQEGGVFAGHHGVQNCLESVAAPQAMPAREGQRRVLVVRNALPPPLHSTAGVCFVSSSSRGRSDKIPGWLHESINEGNFV